MSLLLALLAAAVVAPSDSDYSIGETRKLVATYGRCVVRKEPKQAAEAILRNVNNKILMREYPRLIDGACVPTPAGTTVKVRFKGDQFRYALADALFRKDLAGLPAPVLAAVPALDQRIPTPPAKTDKKGRPLRERDYADALKDYDQDLAFTYLSQFGECVVRANPAGARALLLTDPETAQEVAGFAGLQSAMGGCLEEGHTLAFGKEALRGTIAVNYYRLAMAAAASPSGGAQ